MKDLPKDYEFSNVEEKLYEWEEEKIKNFTMIQEIVRNIRNIRTEKKIPPSKKISATIIAGDKFETINDQATTIIALANLDKNETRIFKDLEEKPANQTSVVISGVELFLPLDDLIDVGAKKARINKELYKVQNQIARLENLLNSPFGEKAPAAVVLKEKEKLSQFIETANRLKQQLDNLA